MPPSLEHQNSVRQQLRQQREPLAVIGIGCRFPGGVDSPTALWEALLNRLNAIRDVPEDRWIHSRFHDPNPEKVGCIRNAKGGFLDRVDEFDAEFFGYFPAEAQRIDPQQRLLLEVTHEAMEDAGLRRDQLDGTRTSVFVGSFMYDYLCMQAASEQRDLVNPYVAMGCMVSPLANRISYDFNLKGPSVSLDTACSSSLVAVHLACRSIWNGEADMAIAGGVNLMLRPESSIVLSKGGFLNPDQYCKAFDASANGYVRGEGVGVVILKPLRTALADGDLIYAWVRGTAVNQDGYLPEGFTVPNVFAQIAMLESAYTQAGVDPLTVDYVEAHGTGTSVGDPIESLALGAVLGRERAEGDHCLMGSVKTNLGHLEGAAGIAGFIKAVLVAKNGVVPPNLHFKEPNPEIDWDNLRLVVPTEPTPLECGEHPWLVGVNSFGAGGTNAHVVLQEPAVERVCRIELPTPTATEPADRPTLYMLSAANRATLQTLALCHVEFLNSTPQRFDDVAYSLFTRRSHYTHMLAVVGTSRRDVVEKLRKFADGQVDPSSLVTTISRRKRPKMAFVFSGQGGQWARMGLELMQREPIFRKWMETIDVLFQRLSGWSLLVEIRKAESESKVNDTVVVQPAVMAIQVALVKLYEHYGIKPAGIVGHSIGEVAAAFAAGALNLNQAVKVIYQRSQAQNRASGKGGMLAVGLSLDEAEKLIVGFKQRVSVGAVNGPEMLTLSGDPGPLEQIAQMLEVRGIFNRPVKVQVAYHSHHMDPIKGVMLKSLSQVRGVKTAIPLYSTVTGKRADGTHLDAEYWFRNAREPVLFTATLNAMLADGFDTFVEIGPHPVLINGAEALFEKRGTDAVMIPAMTRKEPEPVVFLQSFSRLATRGFPANTAVLFGTGRKYVRLPKYPWQHVRHWFETPSAAELRRGRFEHPFLKRQTQLVTEEGLAVWEATLDVQKFPYLRDHRIDGEIVFPATGHLELAWAVASEQFRHESFFLENLQFDSPLILPDNNRDPLEVRLEIISNEGDYRICSRPVDGTSDAPWSKHSSGRINAVHDRFEKSTMTLDEIREQFQEAGSASVDQFYENLCDAGLDYGENFRSIHDLRHRGTDWLAQIRFPDELLSESKRNNIHPALLDACIHVIFADAHRQGNTDRVYLPQRIDRVRFHRHPTQNVWSHVRITRNDEQYLCSDTLIFDEAGELVAELLGLTCKRLVGAGSRQTDSTYDGCYEYQWRPAVRDVHLHGRMFDLTRALLIVPEVQESDGEALTVNLAKQLSAEDVETRILRWNPQDSLDELLEETSLDRRTLIVFAAGLSFGDSNWNGLAHCSAVSSLLQLAQTLHQREGVPRLYLLTNGAAGIESDTDVDLGQAILHGMSRVIRSECPQVPVTVIDLSRAIPPGEVPILVGELLHARRDQDESEIALRGNERYVRLLVPVDRDSAEQAATSQETGCGGAYRADLSTPGALDQITFRRLSPIPFGEDDVEIAVQAAALNFKDVMNAMGMLPVNGVVGGLTEHRLGHEVAGRVLRTGLLVKDIQEGDDVIARVREGFCGRVVTPAKYVFRRPPQLTPLQAATVPLVYVTAWYSLCHLARMSHGETVLIHSAAGGVGIAAIQLARRAGVKVMATAGTKDKREFLRRMGVEHVFNSRSFDFYNQVMEATGGRGVDIVLNSLTGKFIAQSLKCLAPLGRFVELGKSEIFRNSKLNLQRLEDNISYFVVDVDRLAVQNPDLHRQILAEVIELFERGELTPHEITEFPISELPDALKFMTRGAYHGKIVMNMQNDQIQTLPSRNASFRSDRSYLISGGASGFGLEIARWMSSRGARQLVLLSRSGAKSAADREAIESMREQGVRVLVVQADIADSTTVRAIFEQIKRELPPLAGVIHGAAVMDDATIPNIDMKRFDRVFSPKAQGAWNLHEASLNAETPLDFFVMLSSVSSALGLFGQVNYAAANFFLDSLAQYRRKHNLPATSVNLGILGQYAGLSRTLNENQDVIGLVESQGLLVMPLADILAKLEAVLVQQPVQRMTGRFNWAQFRTAYPSLVRDSRFVELMSDAALARGGRAKGASLRAVLAEMNPDQRIERLQQELAGALARILDVPAEKLDVNTSIDHLGLDSLALTGFQIGIVRLLDVNVPLIKLLKGPSIANLSADLLADLDNTNSVDVDLETENSRNSTIFALAELDGIKFLNPWLIRGRGSDNAPFRLICLHSMGVGASLFSNFLINPLDDYDIVAVQTPGRENRIDEPVMQSIDQLADQVAEYVRPCFDRPVVIWGHSFGGLVAWEVIRRLRERHSLEPVHLVVTGTVAPHLVHLWQKREVMLKAMVAENSPEYLISLSRYVDDPEFLKAILPGMRRDFPLLNSFRFQKASPLNCPITAFAARKDDMVYTDEIEGWCEHTRGGFELIEVDGDHWFLNRNRELITSTLARIAFSSYRNEIDHDVRPQAVLAQG